MESKWFTVLLESRSPRATLRIIEDGLDSWLPYVVETDLSRYGKERRLFATSKSALAFVTALAALEIEDPSELAMRLASMENAFALLQQFVDGTDWRASDATIDARFIIRQALEILRLRVM